jgi:two-component system, cell cycle sensor histidine kinase PleC
MRRLAVRILFRPFNRLGAEKSGVDGSGVGLLVSRRFVEPMGGRVPVVSAPRLGTPTVRLQVAPPRLLSSRP